METKPVDQAAPHTLKCQTWVLKVLIHCEGCKKKVKRVLMGTDGVYHTEIDSEQHKVSVTGNVDAETLIKKLLRSGKMAELWPENVAGSKAAKSKSVSDEQKDQNNKNDQTSGSEQHDSDKTFTALRYNHNKESLEGGDQTNKEDSEGDEAIAESGKVRGAGKKKKKKKKQRDGNALNSEGSKKVADASAPVGTTESTARELSDVPASSIAPVDSGWGPPIQHVYAYPTAYYPPQVLRPPPEGLSYNTAYPSSSDASIYAPSMHACTYSHEFHPPPPPPPDPINLLSTEDDEYDDNEIGCFIM